MRGSPTDRRPTPLPGRLRRTAFTAAPAVLLLPLLGAAPPAAQSSAASVRLQGAFGAAAAEYGVPRSVLLGVSYLQSRWDAHGGAPSVTGGYGPMHLTDARTALAEAPHHSEGTEDARGDDSRPPLVAEADLPESSELPSRLRTLTKAAELTGLPARTLRTDAEANVAGGAALLAAAQRSSARSRVPIRRTGTGRWRASRAPTTGRRRRRTRTRCSP